MKREELYQRFMILFMLLVAVFFTLFFWREIRPEYRAYQTTYIELEEMRAKAAGSEPPPFRRQIKQIVIKPEDGGPETIDRCISCHVALKLEHFSPTRLRKDINGEIVRDDLGNPLQEPNPNYIWNLPEAEGLKEQTVAGHEVNMTRALRMHPLIGNETRPFEHHPMEDYGCTSCHGGNGRALTLHKAHGPVYDGEYEEADVGPKKEFLERDPHNDPHFAYAYNHKPGHELLFQTTPLMVGGLIQANCANCHTPASDRVAGAVNTLSELTENSQTQTKRIEEAVNTSKESVIALSTIQEITARRGFAGAMEELQERARDQELPPYRSRKYRTQHETLSKLDEKQAVRRIREELNSLLGGQQQVEEVAALLSQAGEREKLSTLSLWLDTQPKEAKGSLLGQWRALQSQKNLTGQLGDIRRSTNFSVEQEGIANRFVDDIDRLTAVYQRGRELFVSQACYACHRIAGLSRGGVGPELTEEGHSYPWYVKESIVWPQGSLPTSTMPNFRLDHEEVEALMTFVMAQKGRPDSMSEVKYLNYIRQWEAGAKRPWEEPVPPAKIHDLDYSMTVFATEGCASCHRLSGFTSDVGFTSDEGGDQEELWRDRRWFRDTFPEHISAIDLVAAIEENREQILAKTAENVRQGQILEEIEESHPQTIESLYPEFKYALRAKDHTNENVQEWRALVRRVLLLFVQEYGLGRQIGPKLDWSGIYRSDQWLMEHFYNPGGHVARSIMPVFPFDETKFQALTYMLDILGRRNTEHLRQLWEITGYNPDLAYQLQCAQCHGSFREGGGPVAEWIYPIPKNLRNADFLRNLTQIRVEEAIEHGVKGTPMPPWKETPPGKPFDNNLSVISGDEARQLADWLFLQVPGERVLPRTAEPLKWRYRPEDLLEELRKEGDLEKIQQNLSWNPRKQRLFAALTPTPQDAGPEEIQEVFTIGSHLRGSDEKYSYYIRKELYTPNNIEKGHTLFMENCAICHGDEGTGAGLRAATMTTAKPRNFANLDWIRSRDDLRLLRSIKYGVPGTSMTAWGDYTSALQRMQMVMFIRSLSEEQEQRRRLEEAIYTSFDNDSYTIRGMQIDQGIPIEEAEDTYIAKRQQRLRIASSEGEQVPTELALAAYKEELEAKEIWQTQQAVGETLSALIRLIEEEKILFHTLGAKLLAYKLHPSLLACYQKVITSYEQRYQYGERGLLLDQNHAAQRDEQVRSCLREIDEELAYLDTLLGEMKEEESDPKMAKAREELFLQRQATQTVRQELLALRAESKELWEEQQRLHTHLEQQLQEIGIPNSKETM